MSVIPALDRNNQARQNVRKANSRTQEQERLATVVDNSVDADALQDYLLMKIQCAGARPTSRAQIHAAIQDLLQSPTPVVASSSSQDIVPLIKQRSSSSRSMLSVLNAVLAPRRLLQKKRKRDANALREDDSPGDKRRKVLAQRTNIQGSPLCVEEPKRGLLFGVSRVGKSGTDVFGPDGSPRKRRRAAGRNMSSWHLRRAELERERSGKADLGGMFSPVSGTGASPLVASLMSLVLSPHPFQLPDGSPARLSLVKSPQKHTPQALAMFRFSRLRDSPASPDIRQLMHKHVPPSNDIRLPDMEFSPEGLRLSADSIFDSFAASTPSLPMQSPPGLSCDETDEPEHTAMHPSASTSSVPFPTTAQPSPPPPSLPRFVFSSPMQLRLRAPSFLDMQVDCATGYLRDAYPTSPSSRLRPSPVARPNNPTPTAASSTTDDLSLYDEDAGLGYTFSTDSGSSSQLPLRLSTETQDTMWDDEPDADSELDIFRVRSASDARRMDDMLLADDVFEPTICLNADQLQMLKFPSEPVQERWHALKALRR